MRTQTGRRLRQLTHAALIAAMYVILTYFSALLGLSGQGAIQLRLSEMLCVLPYFTPAAIPGVTLGCLLAGFFTGAALPDVLLGTLATLLGAVGARLLKKWRFLTPLPTILVNTAVIPFVIRYAYVGVAESLPFLFASVFVGELICCGGLGLLLLTALRGRELFS